MFVSCSNLMNLKTMSSRRLFQLLDLFLRLLLLIKFANGFNLSAREDRILYKDKERQAQLELKQSLVDDHGLLSSWGIHDCCQWKAFEFLYLSGNDFRGSQFPDFNGSLSRLRLEFLDLSGNNYSVISFDWLYHLSFLKYIDLSSNHVEENNWLKLVNKLPLHLENLQLRSCGLHGFSLASSKLIVLALDGNQLTGPLPNFCNNAFMSLEELDISHNRFNGTVTEILGCLSRLKHLLASQNSMEDLLSPNTLFITKMDLSSNMFDGSLPLLPYINVLNLAKNRFTGSLDPFCKITSKYLTFLESGNIPAWIGENLSSLVFLSLQANDFNGRILANFCWLAHMQILDQSENNISGTIPSCLNNLTAMAQKRVYTYGGGQIFEYVIGFLFRRTGYNYVEKARVRWKGNEYEYERYLGLFKVIDLSSNELTGEIPNDITSLFELVAPNLSRNGLTGLIPHNINQLKQLESLNLLENHLSGRIPVTMADLTFLSYLDLYNKLLGRIPSSTQLQTFDALAFVGNALAFVGNQALCGFQVTVQCTEDDTNMNKPDHNKLENGDVFKKWFYARMRVGF
ncbi:hypothetical protein Goklo_024673 [Gossypium klotzschianum]|uniref:Leucine-rich repeat-containing N-terminal plant-type domain-containing protein n=1 Tax=Gossypium klotzschianum TaxID=34286 RepID=A0A7J8WDJ8_9ROSI|nr:hypothetical protein [Gossypium klotzschianum]